MLKQHKLMKNFRSEYLSLVHTLLEPNEDLQVIQTAYARFVGIAHTTLLVVNYRNRVSIYTHLSRANGLYNNFINEHHERLQDFHRRLKV